MDADPTTLIPDGAPSAFHPGSCSFSFLSVCSGIEAASVAWEPLGWKAQAFAEVEKFPSAVLAHHWPDVPNLGDMTKHHEWPNTLRPDLIVGGTPCQAFSVAGLRKGLADPRGNLTLVFLAILEQLRPRWVLWENVTGVLSDDTGAFGSLLGGLGQLGYGFSYRVLNAQHFGVPQRRRRVFVVGHLGDWRRAASVLFEPACLSGIPSETGQNDANHLAWWQGEGRHLNCIDASYGRKWGSNQWYARGHVIVDHRSRPRRGTPLEIERAFGFPDGHTDIPGATDDARYKALGNSMAVPVMRWIGEGFHQMNVPSDSVG